MDITKETAVDAPVEDKQEAVETTSVQDEQASYTDGPVQYEAPEESEASSVTDAEEVAPVGQATETETSEVPAKFLNESGEVDTQKVLHSYRELEKKMSQPNEYKKKAAELEEVTGMSLDDILAEMRSGEDEGDLTPVESQPDADEVNKIIDRRVAEKYGDKLSRIDDLDRRETVESFKSKYTDVAQYEQQMVDFMKKNPKLGMMDYNEALQIAYLAAKGMSVENISNEAKEQERTEVLNKVADKNAASIEPTVYGGKTGPKVFTREQIAAMDSETFLANQAEIDRQVREGLIK
jgi:hypothetical protein